MLFYPATKCCFTFYPTIRDINVKSDDQTFHSSNSFLHYIQVNWQQFGPKATNEEKFNIRVEWRPIEQTNHLLNLKHQLFPHLSKIITASQMNPSSFLSALFQGTLTLAAVFPTQ